MSDWKEYKLGELATFYNGRAYKNGEFKTSGTPIVRIQNLTGEGKTVYSDLQLDENKYIENGDLIYAWSATFGPYIWRGGKSIYHYHIWKIVCNEGIIDKFYFYYKLKLISDSLKDNGNGSIFVHITKSFMENFKIKIPSLEKQKYISNILSNLDKKIRFNTQINQTLEQIAQALFKSWFVDFDPVRGKVQALSDGLSLEQAELAAMQVISGKTLEELIALSQTQPDRYAELAETAKAFPCEMVEVDGVEVPKGWEYKSVGDFINVVDYVANGSFATLKENVTLLTEPDYAIYIRTTDFNSGFSKELRYVDKSAYDFLAKSVLIGNEVIISNVGDVGTVFRSPSWLGMPMTLGSNAIALKNYDIPHYLYLYFSSHKGQHDISSIVTGSAQLKFNKTNFRSLKVLIPNNSLLTKFEKFVFPIFEKIDANMAENLKLAEIRDLLLPRLLSGDFNG